MEIDVWAKMGELKRSFRTGLGIRVDLLKDIVNKSESKAKAEADLVDYICTHGNLRGHNIIFKRLFDLGM